MMEIIRQISDTERVVVVLRDNGVMNIQIQAYNKHTELWVGSAVFHDQISLSPRFIGPVIQCMQRIQKLSVLA